MTRPEKLSHYAIVVIALTAVFVSVWQGRISQKQLDIAIEHNKLSVQPYLEFIKNIDGGAGTLEINLSNQGYGPAIIRDFSLSYDNTSYDAWNPVLSAANLEDGIRQIYNYSAGSVIAPGADRTILRLKTPNNSKNIRVVVAYESIYHEPDTARINF